MNWEDYFVYDSTSPSCLRWKVDTQKTSAGDVAGGVAGNKYYRVTLEGNKYMAHHVVWEIFNGPLPNGLQIDHEDGFTTNNSVGNLRCVTPLVNSRNRAKASTNTSGVTGVSLTAKRGKAYWRASWRQDGKLRNKCFSVEEFGNDEALRLASQKRNSVIKDGGYTDRHGK